MAREADIITNSSPTNVGVGAELCIVSQVGINDKFPVSKYETYKCIA